MTGRKWWYVLTLLAFALLPLAGCGVGGGSAPTRMTESGTEISVNGQVNASGISAAAAGDLGTVYVYDAQTGTELANGAVAANGSFSGLTFTLPSTKAVLVFKAVVTQGTFRSVVPIDLSNPPAAGTVTGSNPISIVISQESNNTATVVSTLLGLSGVLGDSGMTLDAVTKTYADAAQAVVNSGGQQLAYSGSGLALTGKFASAAMLPALDASNFSVDQLNNMVLDGAITSVSIPGNSPVVNFYVTNKTTGKGIRGLKTFNVAIAQLKPGTAGSPEQWLSYMTTGSTSRPTTESSTTTSVYPYTPTAGSALIDNGDGSYTYKFAKDIKNGTGGTVTYDANLTHRVAVQVRTTPSQALLNNGTIQANFYNEKLLFYDFVPATPDVAPPLARNIVTTDACNECHTKIGVSTPHGGRGDTRYCTMCHTQQRANGRTPSTSAAGVFTGITYVADGEVLGDFVTMIHKIHMGDELTKSGYDYEGVKFDTIVYPKSILNCRQCHKGDDAAQLAAAPQANNWKEKPSRKSCGSCHDGVNFATGVGHEGAGAEAVQASDEFCVGCHGVNGAVSVEKKHLTVDITLNNPSVESVLTNFTYDVNSVTMDANGTSAIVKFRILQSTNGAAATPVTSFTGNAQNPLSGFTGTPSFLFAYNQGGGPDFTNMGHTNAKAAQPRSVTVGSLLASLGTADASGYFTVPIANAFPAGATMRTVALQGYFTQLGVETALNKDLNGDGDIDLPATPSNDGVPRHAMSVVKTVAGDTARRVIVDGTKCGNCHEWFEGHGGNRIVGKGMAATDQNVCVLCHVPGLSSSGTGADINLINFIKDQPVGTQITTVSPITGAAYTTTGTVSQSAKDAMTALVAAVGSDPTVYPEATNNFKDMIHAIHAGSDSLVVGSPIKFVRDRGTSGVFYYDFGFVKFPGIVKRCEMCHVPFVAPTRNDPVGVPSYTAIPAGAAVSTYVTSNGTPIDVTNNVMTIDAARKSLPNNSDLVTTPFAATCVSCHSQPHALAHISQNGGQVKVARSTADPSKEACVTCHGGNGPFALINVHRFSVVGE